MSKKKVAIICNGIFKYSSHAERGLGGSELMVQDLAIELTKTGMYDVEVYSYCHKEEGYIVCMNNSITHAVDKLEKINNIDNKPYVTFYELHNLDDKKVDCDIFISSRIVEGHEKANANIKIFWAHDADNTDLSKHEKHYNWVITPSNWLRNRHVHKKWSTFNRTRTIRHGTYVPKNVEVMNLFTRVINGDVISIDKQKLIFTSVPYKGEGLRDAFPILREKIDVNMHMYSDIRMYGKSEEDIKENLDYYKKFFGESEKNIIWEGTRPRLQLFKDISNAALMFYPNTFEETFCISILEAMSLGIPVVTSELAALKEFIHISRHKPIYGNNEHTRGFVNSAFDILTNENLYVDMANAAYNEAKQYDWPIIITKWVNILEGDK